MQHVDNCKHCIGLEFRLPQGNALIVCIAAAGRPTESPRAIVARAGAVRGAIAVIAGNGDHLVVVACRTHLQGSCSRRR